MATARVDPLDLAMAKWSTASFTPKTEAIAIAYGPLGVAIFTGDLMTQVRL
jgi:hypothetical protein